MRDTRRYADPYPALYPHHDLISGTMSGTLLDD